MSFGEAIRSVLQNYANFNGRARRSEYWFWALAMAIMWTVIVIIGLISTPLYLVLFFLALLGLLLPNWAVAARRLHDTGRSGWYQFIGVIPLIGGIVLIVLLCQDSQPNNEYGPSPKGYGEFGGGGYGGYGGSYPQYPPAAGGYPPPPGNYPPASGGYPPPPGNYPPAPGGYPPPPGNYPPAQ